MTVPHLSPSQRAFLFDQENFLRRIQARAQRLAEDGYTVRASDVPYRFLVVCPAGVNVYAVHALEQTCTCPFFTAQVCGEPLTHDGSLVPCKHLLGLKTLLKQMRARLRKEGDACEAYRLWAHTMALLSAERLLDTADTAETPWNTLEGEHLLARQHNKTSDNVSLSASGNTTSPFASKGEKRR